jgi:hypothetical protein
MAQLRRDAQNPAGSKLWTFISTMDHDFVNDLGQTVPPGLSTRRIFGPRVTCGRFARLFVSRTWQDPHFVVLLLLLLQALICTCSMRDARLHAMP